MTKKSIILIIFSIPRLVSATDYYISSSGNDANSGTSPEQAWKSLEKVNSVVPKPGDQILFKRGDVWHGSIDVTSSGTIDNNIVYGAYGTGEKPIIYGSEIIAEWTLHKGNIYKASVDKLVSQLFVNGERVRLARYPNEGYFYVDFVHSSNEFTSIGLDQNMDYTGATWYGRTRYWYGVIQAVTASDKNTLTLLSSPSGGLASRQGFVLMNKLEFLDQAGEWYFDFDTDSLYLWTPDGLAPGDNSVSVSIYSNGISLKNANYITVENLDFREHNDNGIFMKGNTGTLIDNNSISNPDRYGISAEGGSHTITNNNIVSANGGGVLLWINNSQISDNFIDRTAEYGTIGTKGTTAPNGGSGAEISGDGNIIEYNTIENSNYNGLFYRGESVIQYNFIKNSCLYKDDGGAIYTNTVGSKGIIRYNITLNSIGNPEGATSTRSLAEGIYIDETARDVIVEYNTIINCGNTGVYLHNVGNIQVSNNTIMSVRYGIMCNVYVDGPSSFNNNIVYLTSASDDYEPRQLFARVVSYNTIFDYNTYINPYASAGVFRKDGYLSFSQWQSEANQDAHSTFDGTPLATGESQEIYYNKTKKTQTYTVQGSNIRNIKGESVSEFSLEPFTSIILLGKDMEISEISTPVSTLEKSKEMGSNFLLYPNPAQDYIIIDFSSQLPIRNSRIDIIDNSGRILSSQPVISSPIRISLSPFRPGIYYVRSEDGLSQVVKKFIL